jgi:hypothetical protein
MPFFPWRRPYLRPASTRAARSRLLAAPGVRDPLSRRTILKGVLGGSAVTIGLPLLEAMLPRVARANDDAVARRFVLFFWGNGNRPDLWTPIGEGEDFTLSETLSPLDDLIHKLTVVSGLAVKIPNELPHTSGLAGVLSARRTQAVGTDNTLGGPTIDQILAQEIGGSTLYRSLQTAATDVVGVSYNGPNSVNPPETDPHAFFDRLFGPTFVEPGDEPIIDPTLGLRQSVLDGVLDDLLVLQSKVGAADKIRIEQHLDGVRELETRLAKLQEDPPDLAACSRPGEPLGSYPDIDGRPQIAERSRVMAQMIAMALACDQTRVVSHVLTDPVSEVLFPGASGPHHTLTHDEPGDQPEVASITKQCVEELGHLLRALDAVQEGEGTLLDACLVMGCSEVSLGQTHAIDDLPIVLAGGACGSIKTGYHYHSATGENATRVLLSICKAMGAPQASLGADEGEETQSLTDIEQ